MVMAGFNFETFPLFHKKTENALQGAPMDVWDMDNSSAVPDACRENISKGREGGERVDGTGFARKNRADF